MKRFILCVQALALCLLATQLNAQSDWKWIYPNVQGKTLNDIDVMWPTSAIAVGVWGTVITTTDRGLTWNVRPTIPGVPDLNGVSAITSSTIIAVSNAGMILRSVNGGRTWSTQTSGTPDDLFAVDFIGMLNGFAVGSNGTILRSHDAGISWETQTSGTTATLRAIHMFDENTATTVGSGGTILKTADFGVTWVPEASGTTADLNDVKFFGTEPGMAVGSGAVLITLDGGATWLPPATPAPFGSSGELRAVDVAGFPQAVIVGNLAGEDNFAMMIRTSDGGVSWGAALEIRTAGLSDVAMFTSSEGLAIGGAGAIRKTTDGGVTWPQVAGGAQNWAMACVDFFDELRGMATANEIQAYGRGPSGAAYLTTDGGVTWRGGPPLQEYTATDVSFADANTIYVVGNGPGAWDVGGTIWRSTDGGASWEEIYTACCWPACPWCARLSAVDFAGTDVGVVVGWGLVTIHGGGAGWVDIPTTERLNGVSVPTPEVAYAVGRNGVIIKGDLVGGSWVLLNSGTSVDLLDVCFTDDMTGTAVGGGGIILHTSDGGDSWDLQTSGTTDALTCVSFIDASNGLIGTGGAALLGTRDGGATWRSEEMPFPLVDVDFVDPLCAVAVGGMMNVIMHRDGPVPVFFQDVSATVHPYSVDLHWAVSADEPIQGFRVYRSAGGAGEVAITSELLAPSDRLYIDRDVVPGGSYEYSVAAFDEGGAMIRSRPVSVRVPAASVALFQNIPNPFNPTTRIGFTLPARVHVTLSVFDVAGRRIATLLDGVRPSGANDATWDGKDSNGDPAPSGIYFYELRTQDVVISKKMVLLK